MTRASTCMMAAAVLAAAVGTSSTSVAAGNSAQYLNPSANDTVQWLPARQADQRILYDTSNSNTFGDLRLPKGHAGRSGYPVVLFIHGGGWTSDWSLEYAARMVDAFTEAGFATWSIELRRFGNVGGGWPDTFLDAAHGADYLRTLATQYPLDLNRVIAVGHSSGGHLVTWLAVRHKLPTTSALYIANPLPLRGVVGLGAIPDLQGALTLGNRTDVFTLLGVTNAADAAKRYPDGSPVVLLPSGVPQIMIDGTLDNAWRVAINQSYVKTAVALGENMKFILLDGANHFDLVDACGPAWRPVIQAALELAGESGKGRIRTPGDPACPGARDRDDD